MHKLALRVVRQEIKIDRSTCRSSVKTVLLVRASSVAAMFSFFSTLHLQMRAAGTSGGNERTCVKLSLSQPRVNVDGTGLV